MNIALWNSGCFTPLGRPEPDSTIVGISTITGSADCAAEIPSHPFAASSDQAKLNTDAELRSAVQVLPELGDVSQGQLLTIKSYYALMVGILTPVQIEGLQLLLTPFPQEEFNQTEDRKSADQSLGIACLDCHSNFHTNAHSIRHLIFVHKRIPTPHGKLTRSVQPANSWFEAIVAFGRGFQSIRTAHRLLA